MMRRMAALDRRLLRMPLATGGGALSMLTLPVGVFQILVFGSFFFSEVPDWVPRWVGGVLVLVLGVLWAVWIFVVLGALIGGWARRCSDIVLSQEGLLIKGGPGGGLVLRWDKGPRCRLQPASGEPATELHIEGRRVAISEDEEELRSFSAVAETVGALGRSRTAAPMAPRPQVLTCSRCGAAVAPAPGEHVPCVHCGTDVEMPGEVRDRFRALNRLEAARSNVEGLLRRLLRQRGARFTNAVFALALPPLLLGFPLTAILFNELFVVRHVLRGMHALWLLLFALGFTYGLQLWLRAQVAGRRALRLVALSYRARPPREGAPWSCRLCGGTLPETAERLIVLCLYCQSENLTGLNLSEDAGQMKAQVGSLQQALHEQLRRRRRWRIASVAAIGLLLISGAMLLRAFPRTCRDGVKNGEETDVDCGGVCLRCTPGHSCRGPADCTSRLCEAGTCAAPSCNDRIKNGMETDVDCGGSCKGCPEGHFCSSSKDCQSQRCGLSGQCAQAP